ncbi:nucleotidyl transferase, partial [mine drainage metagenome]
MVAYAVEALVNAGITEVMLVTGGTHAGEFLRLLGNGHEYGIDRLAYAYQERAAGIADALGLAERFVDDDLVAVMLADNILERSLGPSIERFTGKGSGAQLLLWEEHEVNHLQSLGVAEFGDNGEIVRIVEKPSDPPSKLAVTGIYLYDSEVFRMVRNLEPSARGELEITDVNNFYVEAGRATYDI